MQNILQYWSVYKESLVNKHIALFLDFDGTLSPIAPTPDEAVLPNENKILLQKLSNHKTCKVTIVSGRPVEDIKRKIGINNVICVGNHGLEIHGLHIHFENLLPLNMKHSLRMIKEELSRVISPIEGAILENKELTLSLHYRLVDEENIMDIKKIFFQVCEPYRRKGEIQISFGKKVLEVRPCLKWNKGHAVSWLLKKYSLAINQPITPIYIGDDETDEDAFAMLKDLGLTVIVGQQPSQADYYVKDTSQVTSLLKEILLILDDTNQQRPLYSLSEQSL